MNINTNTNIPKRIKREYFKKFPPKTKAATRGTKWGNPFKIIQEDGAYYVKDLQGNYWGNNDEGYQTKEDAAKQAVSCFRRYLSEQIRDGKLNLSDFDNIDNIGCFCKLNETCHVDVIIEYIEMYRNGQTIK